MSSERRIARRGVGAVLLLALLGGGCGESEVPPGYARRAISVKDVPETAMATARKRLPGVDFAEAWKIVGPKGEIQAFEVRGRAANGKVREVKVSPLGEFMEEE